MTYIPEDQLYKAQMKAMAQTENQTTADILTSLASMSPTTRGVNQCEFMPFDQFFKTTAGSKDMRVNATLAAPVTFSVKASPDFDIFIRSISARVQDMGSSMDKFAGVNALTNGLKFSLFRGATEYIMREGNIKNMIDFYRLGAKTPLPETSTGGLKITISLITSEIYQPQIDLAETYGYPSIGLKLRKGSTDSLAFVVQDNLTGLDEFTIIASGSKI